MSKNMPPDDEGIVADDASEHIEPTESEDAEMDRQFREKNLLLSMDIETMLDAVNRDIADSTPTIAAIELRPHLSRTLELLRMLGKNTNELDDDERISAIEELATLKKLIVEKYLDWKTESVGALIEVMDGDRMRTSGTVVVPPNWNNPDKPLN